MGQRENSGACLGQVLPAHGHTHLCKDCPRLTSALSSWVKELRDLLKQKAKLNLPALALKKILRRLLKYPFIVASAFPAPLPKFLHSLNYFAKGLSSYFIEQVLLEAFGGL